MLTILTPPPTPPYSLDRIKNYLRVLDTHQDEQIELLAKAHLLKAEEITNLVLQGVTEFKWTIDGGFRDLILPKNPVTEIVKIEYIDTLGDVQEFDLNNMQYSFPLDATKSPFTIFFKGDLPYATEIIITFRAGFASLDSRVEMWLNAKIGEDYDGLTDKEKSRYIDRMLDSLRVNYI